MGIEPLSGGVGSWTPGGGAPGRGVPGGETGEAPLCGDRSGDPGWRDRCAQGLRRGLMTALQGTFAGLNRVVPWYRLPRPLAILNAELLREELCRSNLFHAGDPLSTEVEPCPPRWLGARESSGGYNDLRQPDMGAAGQPFGRNVPLECTVREEEPRLLEPNPFTISSELLERRGFIPATSLNLLAAAWIQFQVHDWVSHERPVDDHPWEFPGCPVRIRRTPEAASHPVGDRGRRYVYRNRDSHWWDASQIYGSDERTTAMLRSSGDGKLAVDERTHLLPVDRTIHQERSGFTDNWWLGLDIMHTLFTLEHNVIVDRLRAEHPSWSPEDLFDTARLINVAVMAKIHVVEWTPAILATPTVDLGETANWWGLEGEGMQRLFGRLSRGDVCGGILGSPTDHFDVPYSLTEEFVSVYRLHPLIPDSIRFFSVRDGSFIESRDMVEVAFRQARERLQDPGHLTMADAIYSFGIAHPGAITLHNFPSFLRNLRLPPHQLPRRSDGTVDDAPIDLAAIDVMRDRERGVPRYNALRRALRMRPVRSFEELNPEAAEELSRVYPEGVEQLDLMVGLMAEKPPPGFGFSETAFRIFLLMAYRRLKSDRFFTADFTPEVYTRLGMEWIDAAGMTSVLLRHYPQLKGPLRGIRNPFRPWQRVGVGDTAREAGSLHLSGSPTERRTRSPLRAGYPARRAPAAAHPAVR
jgi:Animal haem peroxidase